MAAKRETGLSERKDAAGKIVQAGKKRRRQEKKQDENSKKPAKFQRREERYEVMKRSRQLWEFLRTEKPGSPRSVELVSELLDALGGRLLEFCFRHDGSRIIQGMIQKGKREQKDKVFSEILGKCDREDWARLICDRYGRHLGLKITKGGGKVVKEKVFEEFVRGGVGGLMKSVYGAEWLDITCQTMFNGHQRSEIVVELLFGRERKLYETVVLPSLKRCKDEEKMTFGKALKLVGEEFVQMVLRNAGSYLASLIEKESIMRSSVVHGALLEYLSTLTTAPNDDPTTAVSFAQVLAPSLVHFTHTKKGATLCILIIKLIAAKHRKQAVRSLKSHVRQILEDDAGHIVLIALFSLVDDTVLLTKQLAAEILSSSALAAQSSRIPKPKKQDFDYVYTICSHPHARMIILYLLHGSDSRYFHPELYGAIWRPLKEPFPNNSKKDSNLRRAEMLKSFLPALESLCETSKLSKLISDVQSAPVAIGLCIREETVEAAAEGLCKILGNAGVRKEVDSTLCGRKTVFAMVKAGQVTVAQRLASQTPKILLDVDCRLAVTTLRKSKDVDAARIVLEQRRDLEDGAKELKKVAQEISGA